MDGCPHDWMITYAFRADANMTWLVCCGRCGAFDEFGTDEAGSDTIWRLLVEG